MIIIRFKRIVALVLVILIMVFSFVGASCRANLNITSDYTSHAVAGVDDGVLIALAFLSACGVGLSFSNIGDSGNVTGAVSSSLHTFCTESGIEYSTFYDNIVAGSITESAGYRLTSDVVNSLSTYVDWFKDYYFTSPPTGEPFNIEMYDNLSTVSIGDLNVSLLSSTPIKRIEFSNSLVNSRPTIYTLGNLPLLLHNNGYSYSMTYLSSTSDYPRGALHHVITNGTNTYTGDSPACSYENPTRNVQIAFFVCSYYSSIYGLFLVPAVYFPDSQEWSSPLGSVWADDGFSSLLPISASDIHVSSVNAVGTGAVSTPSERIKDYEVGQDVIVRPADGTGQSISNDDVLSYASNNDFGATFEGADTSAGAGEGEVASSGSISGDGGGSGVFEGIGKWILDIPILGSILEALINGFDSLLAFLQALFSGLTGGIGSAIGAISDLLLQIWEAITSGALVDGLTTIISLITTGIQTLIDTITGSISTLWDNIVDFFKPKIDMAGKFIMSGVKDKFPFSIPFDLIDMFRVLNGSAVTPDFTIPVHIPLVNINYTFKLNFAQFDGLANILRNIEFIAFAVALALITRNVIRG
ncbi:MAG: hypothetical protein GX663_08970 [Clostridiales bacterium]|nr:hypothetical protein [Clostridiales bacterium]